MNGTLTADSDAAADDQTPGPRRLDLVGVRSNREHGTATKLFGGSLEQSFGRRWRDGWLKRCSGHPDRRRDNRG
jgi:hypothetical protein